MSDNLPEGCPTAADLFAYMQSSDAVSSAVRRHIDSCLACSISLQELKKAGPRAKRPEISADLNRTVDQQREHMRAMIGGSDRIPRVGEVWATRRHSRLASSPSQPLVAVLVLILRSFVREYTGTLVADVAPVTDDPRAAADWSIIFDNDQSGIGTTVVAHLDAQVTTSLDYLSRYVGSLASFAFADLKTALRAFDCAEAPPSDLKVARMGQAAARRLAAWLSISEEFEDLAKHIAVVIVRADNDDEETAPGPTLPNGYRAPPPPIVDNLTGSPGILDSNRPRHPVWNGLEYVGKVAEQGQQPTYEITVAYVFNYCQKHAAGSDHCRDLLGFASAYPDLPGHLATCSLYFSQGWQRSLIERVVQVIPLDQKRRMNLLDAIQRVRHECLGNLGTRGDILSRAARSTRIDDPA